MHTKQPTTCALLLILALSLHTQAQVDVRLPPSIVDGPPSDYLFQSSAPVPLTCTAVGTAELSYVWRKNGIGIDCGPSTRYLCIGNKIVSIGSPIADDEGYYQCFVSNSFGSTMSNVMRLRLYDVGPSVSTSTHLSVDINQGVSLACNVPATVPTMEEKAQNADSTTPLIEWKITNGPDDNALVPVETSSRVQLHGSTGDLYFSNFDTLGSTYYKCQTIVPNDIALSGFTNVTVVGNAANFPVSNIITNMIPSVGLERQSVVFQCLFQGRPTPQLNAASWKKVGGSLPNGRYNHSEFFTKLRISNLQQSDAGEYTCEPIGSPGAIQTMSLTIQAAPEFLTEDDQPHNINASDDDTITFNCSAYAIPTASIIWYRNGEQLVPNALPAKYQMSADETQLIISNVCKDCGGGTSDLASIQCNASNEHGYIFVQGYLNVLKRTSITSQPVNEGGAQKVYVFDCVATTDDSTTLTTAWYLDGLVVRPDPVISIYDNGTLVIDMRNLTEVEFRPYCQTYTCLAANGFSTDSIESTIDCAVIVKSSNSWVIGVVVVAVLLLLLLLLLLLYFCCIKDNEGDIYLVDEKERENGNDPIQEIRDEDFQDYKRDAQGTGYGTMNSGFSEVSNSNMVANNHQYPTGLGLTTFGQPPEPAPAYEPFDFNTHQNQLQRNNSAVLYSTENGGQINFHRPNDHVDNRSIESGFSSRPGTPGFTPVAYAAQPNQIQLIENGVPYGNSQPDRSAKDSGSYIGGSLRNNPQGSQLFDVDLNNEYRGEQQQHDEYRRGTKHSLYQPPSQQQQQQQQQYDDQFDGQGGAYGGNQEGHFGGNAALAYGLAVNNYNSPYRGDQNDQQYGQAGPYNVNNQRIDYDDDDDFNYRDERRDVPTGWAALNMHDNVTSDV